MISDQILIAEGLRRRAMHMIGEAIDLTEGLNRWPSGFIAFWPRVQARAAVDDLLASEDLTTLPAEDVCRMLEERLEPLFRYVSAIKALANERSDLTRRQAYKRLRWIQDLARELPSPPQTVPSTHMLKRFAKWVPEADGPAYVWSLVTMLANQATPLETIRIGPARMRGNRSDG